MPNRVGDKYYREALGIILIIERLTQKLAKNKNRNINKRVQTCRFYLF